MALTIPDAILERATSHVAVDPALSLDVWVDKGPEYRIDTRSQWIAADDPMKGSDNNVSFTRIPGSATLAEGSAVASSYSAPNATKRTMTWQAYVQDRWETAGSIFNRHYSHLYYERGITASSPAQVYPFTAKANQILDSLTLRIQRTGNLSVPIKIYVLDNSGSQVGSSVTITPPTAQSSVVVSGLAASLQRSKPYRLVITYLPPALGSLGGAQQARLIYTFTLNIWPYAASNINWRIPVGGGYLSAGGNEGFQSSGVMTRQFDLGEIPSINGTVTVSDIVPNGTALSMTAYYTDSDLFAAESNNANWTLYGAVVSGDVIPPHRYWRIQFDMTANSANDLGVTINEARVRFRTDPLTFGTHAQQVRTRTKGYAVPWVIPLLAHNVVSVVKTGATAFVSASQSSSQLTPKARGGMVGRMTCKLAAEIEVHSLLAVPLRGREARVRVGYADIEETMVVYQGVVTDLQYGGLRYTLSIEDDLNFADVRLPTTKHGPAWTAVNTYAIDDPIIFGTNGYTSLQNGNLNHTPVVGGNAWWRDEGTVWANIIYDSTTSGGGDWHLADVAKDLLINHINLPSERIDFESIAAVKAAYPNRKGSRIITKPTSALKMLEELAWLLESQWSIKGSLLAMQAEPLASDEPVESITSDDVREGLKYRRGYNDLKNECLILTNYGGDGDGEENFSGGESVIDATSIIDYDITTIETFEDKWNVPASELVIRATNFVDRFKDGRRVVTFTSGLRLLRLTNGDVVSFESMQLPEGDPGPFKMMVVRRDLDWSKQNLKLTLMEV